MQRVDHLSSSNSLFEQAISALRRRLWTGIMIGVLIALISARSVRYLAGVESTPLAVAIQVALYIVVFLSLFLRNSRHAPAMQTLFLFCMHLIIPTVTLLYGGARGLGDLGFIAVIALSSVYGWRRWMYGTFTLSIGSLIYSIYLELIGQPLPPFIDDLARLSSLKLILLIMLVSTMIVIGKGFYSQLLAQYQLLVDEQLRLTDELNQSTQQLTVLSADLARSRQKIVTSREEERRRLRRDLEGRISPMLASLSYLAGAVRNAIRRQSPSAEPDLNTLESNIKGTLGDVRSFVYALHPPMLDQLGLIGAINEYVRRLDTPFEIELTLPTELDNVSASAEISVFQLLQSVLDLVDEHDTTEQVIAELRADSTHIHLNIVIVGIASVETLSKAGPLLIVSEQFNELGGEIVYADMDSAEIATAQIRGNVPI